MVRNGLAACWPVRSALTQKGRWLDLIEGSSIEVSLWAIKGVFILFYFHDDIAHFPSLLMTCVHLEICQTNITQTTDMTSFITHLQFGLTNTLYASYLYPVVWLLPCAYPVCL